MAGQTGTPTSGTDVLTGFCRSGVLDTRSRKKIEGGIGFYSTRRVEGARDQFYPLKIGMEGATKVCYIIDIQLYANLFQARMVCMVIG